MGFIVEGYGDFMHMSLLLMEQILELFLMILMGFIIVKAGLVTDEDSKVLSKIVLYLIIPCVIINAFQVNYTPKTVHGLLIAFIASVMLQILLLIIVSFMGKLFCLNEVEIASIYRCSLSVSEYCRSLSLGGRPRERYTEEERQLLRDIAQLKGTLQRLNNYFGGRQYREVFEENRALITELKKILSR